MIKRRTYLCICEGQQETMYLAHIARLLTHFPERVVKIQHDNRLPLGAEKAL